MPVTALLCLRNCLVLWVVLQWDWMDLRFVRMHAFEDTTVQGGCASECPLEWWDLRAQAGH